MAGRNLALRHGLPIFSNFKPTLCRLSALGKLVAHVQSHVRSGEHTLLEANTHINTRIRTHDKHILSPT